jgi:hypothetical protein
MSEPRRRQATRVPARLAKLEREVALLRNTLVAVTTETSQFSINGPCDHCEQCLLLTTTNRIYCPHCKVSRPL